MSDDELDGLSALEIFFVLIRQTLELGSMLDVDVGDGLLWLGVQGLLRILACSTCSLSVCRLNELPGKALFLAFKLS
jgi:hypothetical protein